MALFTTIVKKITAQVNGTIMKRWNLKSQYLMISELGHHLGHGGSLERKSVGKNIINVDSFSLNDDLMEVFMIYISSDESQGHGSGQANKFMSLPSAIIGRRRYTPGTLGNNNGNSNVEFLHADKEAFGQIQTIFQAEITGKKIWLIIKPFESLRGRQKSNDPFSRYPGLNALILSARLQAEVLIPEEFIIGHIAMLKNISGLYGINQETWTVVKLGKKVSPLD